jgi:hypothetical protein
MENILPGNGGFDVGRSNSCQPGRAVTAETAAPRGIAAPGDGRAPFPAL